MGRREDGWIALIRDQGERVQPPNIAAGFGALKEWSCRSKQILSGLICQLAFGAALSDP
jgi:hypothetical protein